MFEYFESASHNGPAGSLIKALMTSCDIPRLVGGHVTVQRPFIGRNLGPCEQVGVAFDMLLCFL